MLPQMKSIKSLLFHEQINTIHANKFAYKRNNIFAMKIEMFWVCQNVINRPISGAF